MRFKLSTIFWAVGLSAVLCGIVFLAPLLITAVFLSFTLAISPAAWITGAVFARGRIQAFFIGGILTGCVPHILSTYYSYMIAIESADSITDFWPQLGVTETAELFQYRIIFALAWLMPGVFSFGGGALAWTTHRFVVERKPFSQCTEQSKIRDYHILSGRLQTTLAKPEAELSDVLTQGN